MLHSSNVPTELSLNDIRDGEGGEEGKSVK